MGDLRNQTFTLKFDTEARRAMHKLTQALENQTREMRIASGRRPPVSITNHLPGPCTKEHVAHNEDTLSKVREALMDAYPGPHEPSLIAQDMINAMLNAGILFRERERDGSDTDSGVDGVLPEV